MYLFIIACFYFQRLLLWDDEECLAGLDAQFDFIVCADCLFFDEFRRPLLRTISRLLKPTVCDRVLF